MKKEIDEATARTLCGGCIYQKDLDPRCLKCFVNVLGKWTAQARVPANSGRAKALEAAQKLAEERAEERRNHAV